MFLVTMILMQLPENMTTVYFNHSSPQAYNTVFQNLTAANYNGILNLINNIPLLINLSSLIAYNSCIINDQFCVLFTSNPYLINQNNFTAMQYYLYTAFIEAIVDPMMTAHYQPQNVNKTIQFGYSITIYEGIDINGTDISLYFSDLVQPLLFQLVSTGSQNYTALTAVGYPGFFTLCDFTINQLVAWTHDFGNTQDIPAYNISLFTEYFKNWFIYYKQRMSQMLLCIVYYDNISSNFNISQYIANQQISYPNVQYIYSWINLTQNSANSSQNTSAMSGYYALHDNSSLNLTQIILLRTIVEWNTVQSSCRPNISRFNFSDYRMVQMQNNLNALQNDSDIQFETFISNIQQYPLRSNNTAGLAGYSLNNEQALIESCLSIYNDEGQIIQCANSPVIEQYIQFLWVPVTIISAVLFLLPFIVLLIRLCYKSCMKVGKLPYCYVILCICFGTAITIAVITLAEPFFIYQQFALNNLINCYPGNNCYYYNTIFIYISTLIVMVTVMTWKFIIYYIYSRDSQQNGCCQCCVPLFDNNLDINTKTIGSNEVNMDAQDSSIGYIPKGLIFMSLFNLEFFYKIFAQKQVKIDSKMDKNKNLLTKSEIADERYV